MKKVILAISGRKQSGKSSTLKFIEDAWWNDNGVKVEEFSFAGPLKQMCVKILGVDPDQVYGTDEEKNSPVPHLLWENFPVSDSRKVYKPGGVYVESLRTGPMTAREVMQYWGTEVFRRSHPNVWAEAAVVAIDDWADERGFDTPPLDRVIAVLPDCRFPNEVQAVKDAGGYVLRLTRNPFPDDAHPSEVALDRDHYDWANFDHILDNDDLSVEDQMTALTPWLCEIGAIS